MRILPRQLINLRRETAAILGVLAIALFVAGAPVRAEDDATPIAVGLLTGPAPYYGFSEATGEPVGFANEMWAEVAKRAGLSYHFVYFDTVAQLYKAAAENKLDVVPLLVINKASRELFDFSETVHVSRVSIFTRKGRSDIAAAADLAGHRVSVVEGHVGQELMQAYRGELSITHDSLDEALSALMTKTSDAVIYQDHIMWQHARKQGVESLLTTAGAPLLNLDLAVAVRKGRVQLRAALVPAVSSYLQSEAFYAARQPWGGNPPPLIAPSLIATMLGALLAATVVGFGFWRHISVVKLNQALAKSIHEQQSAEQRFKDVAEAASDWFFEQDADLRFTFISSRFEEVMGIAPDRLIGQTRWDDAFRHGSTTDIEKWREHISTLEAHKDWRDFTYTMTANDGSTRTVTTSGKAIYDANGRFTGYRGVGRDITRRIELEGALQQAQKMELVGQLTGGIAHDFNNLLTVMVGNLEMLKRHLRNDARCHGFVETASDAVDIGAQLVQRLLGFSRRQSLNPQNVDVADLINGMKRLVQSSLGPTIDVTIEAGTTLPPVFADEAQLQNALLNLAINSRDAMPKGGRLTIETAEAIVDEAFVELHPSAMPGHYIALRISDTGSGIAKSNLDKVIEPFFTTKEVGKGSGLGLSTVYGFARQSGGFLLIESEVGVGTAVSIYLPVAESPHATSSDDSDPAHQRTAQERDTGGGQKVLVVEDDARVREITTARLEYLGYQVIEAGDAASALHHLELDPGIELLLTDIMMPGQMSGIELAQRVRQVHPKVKILFSASYSKQADLLHEQGRLGPWLRKPYRQAELAEKVREVLDA